MDHTPEQSAVAENAERDAAFERARRKLAAIRKGNQSGWHETRFGLHAAQIVVCVFGWPILTLLVWKSIHVPSLPPESIEEWSRFLTIAVVLVYMAMFTVRTMVAVRGGTFALVREFYGRASNRRGEATLHELVTDADFDGHPRQLPEFASADPAPYQPRGLFMPLLSTVESPSPESTGPSRRIVSGPRLLEAYWRRVLTDDRAATLTVRLRKGSFLWLTPDLVAANLQLVVTRLPVVRWINEAALWLPAAIFSVCLALADPAYVWTAALAYIFVGTLVGRAAERFNGRRMRVQKLLVRTGDRWRLFNGDWQGIEEADLSWLDRPELFSTAKGVV